MKPEWIEVRGAKEHNLKNIDISIPRDKFVVITGISGSGKSSLAFDTIYAEGQRSYVESLSAYARQFLERMDKPDVESIEGLSPAISIEQKSVSKNPRSTVGTITEIYDYLRLLFAKIGRPYCYKCGREISSQTIQQMRDQLMELPEGSRLIIYAPIVRGRKGEFRQDLKRLRRDGFVRVRVNGELRELEEKIELDKNKKHTIEVVVDRVVIKENVGSRLADSLEIAANLTDGIVKVEVVSGGEFFFSEKFACIECGISYPEISPRMFSFNNPYGACPTCDGLGTTLYFDPELVVPNPDLSLREGAIVPWERRSSIYFHQMIDALSEHYQFDIYTPFKNLPQTIKNVLLYGSGDEKIRFYYENDEGRHFYYRPFEGVIKNLERRYKETDSEMVREEMRRYINAQFCPACNGARLRPESLFIKVKNKSINEVTALSVKEGVAFFENLSLSEREHNIARRILKEIVDRYRFMENVGLNYLTLDRAASTLSGGEGQRIRLATQIGSSLVGVLYILDEPSIGLHPRDNRRLLDTLIRLRDMGNTVLVIEHDEMTINEADYVVDMGPGAGVHGGEVVAVGTPEEIKIHPDSLTGKYLSGRKSISVPEKRRPPVDGHFISVKGAAENNLKNIDVDFPVGLFTCVTGVSGSGKSTLVIDTLYKALAQKLYYSKVKAGTNKGIKGLEYIDKVIDIDQSPIGRTPRSNPATYTGVFTPIRDLYSNLPESKMAGYKPGRFSFNVKGGRCETCQGDGIIKIEMHFLPDVYIVCEACRGKRYNPETLEIRYKGKNIADILDMTVNQALMFLENIPQIRKKLKTLQDVGLGYIKLGQSATTLSGGEAQRIKLAKELSKKSSGRTIYILDEPTTGLHFDDIKKLLGVLKRLTDAGNTIVVIEHNLEVIKSADYIIDLGPEGGDEGGCLVASGTPEKIAANVKSYTGRFLREVLIRD